jgi:uncharacterized alkaline shock family protein YloU
MASKTRAAVEPADRIAAAVQAVPGVAGLHAGMFGEIGTYLPGRRVPGVRITDGAVAVHVTVMFDASVRDTAAAVRSSVAALLPGTAVDVTVEDVVPADPPENSQQW